MLIATFGPSSGWIGKTITHDGATFILEDHGPITPHDVLEYDRQGHLVWATEGTRASVAVRAQTAPRTTSIPAAQRQSAARRSADTRTAGQRAAGLLGLLLVVFGLGAAVYFFLFFDTSVGMPATDLGNGLTVGGGRVNNLGLMEDHRNGIVFGFGMAAVGTAFMYIGRLRKPEPRPGHVASTCASCGGGVDSGSPFCPHCGTQLHWAQQNSAPG